MISYGKWGLFESLKSKQISMGTTKNQSEKDLVAGDAIQPGDVVRLRSGGRAMTAVRGGNGLEWLVCYDEPSRGVVCCHVSEVALEKIREE
jgi:hypothetical protein